MTTDAINHDPARCSFLNTGSSIPGRPSMGSWLTYGLGSDAEDLTGFVVLTSLGMFDDTIIVWAGEFGRTPMSQDGSGRDHHILGFKTWMDGGGIKGGTQWGETDEFGYKAVKDFVHVHDMHASMLHQLGIDHTKLVYRQQGRDYLLTDVFGKVVKGILA